MKPIHTIIPFVAALVAVPCLAQEACEPGWVELFSSGTFDASATNVATQLVEHDDGSGPALYTNYVIDIGDATPGYLSAHASVRWNGLSWHVVKGPSGREGANSLCVHDDGTGAKLYGSLTYQVNGQNVLAVVRWNGEDWDIIGEVTRTSGTPQVRSTVSFDGGSGPALYVSGLFSAVNGVAADSVARWDGQGWSNAGSFTGTASSTEITNLTRVSVGPAKGLYASRSILIKRWDGTRWFALGSGISSGVSVAGMAEYDFGNGPELVVGGDLTQLYGTPVSNLARWNGQAWSAFGFPNGQITAVATLDTLAGPSLMVGGGFGLIGGVSARNVAAFSDGTWHSMNAESFQPRAFASFGAALDGSICMTGSESGNLFFRVVKRWNGAQWEPLDGGLGPSTAAGLAAIEYDEPDGRHLFVGGTFTRAGAVQTPGIARWDGKRWSAVGGGLSGGATNYVRAIATHDDGTGLSLYVAGDFTVAGGQSASGIARWDGTAWRAVGTGLSTNTQCLFTYDSGTTHRLLAGTTGGLRQWDGASWQTMGTMTGSFRSFAVFDAGSGPRLYACGTLSIPGVGSGGLAVWNGTSWAFVGTFGGGVLNALATFDDGAGAALFVGGNFTSVNGAPSKCAVRWDGNTWSPLGDGTASSLANITSMRVLDDGRGAALFVGGQFSALGSVPLANIARWNGLGWSALGSGMSQSVSGLAAAHDDSGVGLVAVGTFQAAGNQSAARVASWSRLASWPRITLNPADTTTNAARPVTLSVRSLGSDLTFQWRKDGSPLSDSDRIFGTTTRDLTINPVDLSDAGSYDAIVSNDCAQLTSAAAALTVLCTADFDQNTFVNGVDFDAFIEAFELGLPAADIDGSGWVNGVDFDTFTAAFVAGC